MTSSVNVVPVSAARNALWTAIDANDIDSNDTLQKHSRNSIADPATNVHRVLFVQAKFSCDLKSGRGLTVAVLRAGHLLDFEHVGLADKIPHRFR